MSQLNKLITEIELHSVKGIRDCFAAGINPNDLYNGQPLLYELISEYTRSPNFKNCVHAFVEYGLQWDDKALLAVLLDDAALLEHEVKQQPELISKKYTLRCSYTPLYEASLLHICAEYNHVSCAAVLVNNGADVDAPAGVDEHGFGAQTPIFHTVNQNNHQSADMLRFLLANSANLTHAVKGLVWGKGYEWETLIPSVNPISYAMMGLLPQMHRDERTISGVVATLLEKAYGIIYEPANVPCAYLKK